MKVNQMCRMAGMCLLVTAVTACASKGDQAEPEPLKTTLMTTTPLGKQIPVDLTISEMSPERLSADAVAYGEAFTIAIDIIEPYVEDTFVLTHPESGDSLTVHEWSGGDDFEVILIANGRRYVFRTSEDVAAFDPTSSVSGSHLISLFAVFPALRQAMFGAPLDGEDVALAAAECAACARELEPITWTIGACVAAGGIVVGAYCAVCAGTEKKCGAAGCNGNTFYSCPCTDEDACDLCLGTCSSECTGPAGPLGPCNP